MVRYAITLTIALLLAGCASTPHGTLLCADSRPANLAIGPMRDQTVLAEAFAYRPSWPAADAGYHFADSASYTEVIYDDQSFYDWRLGGGYTHASVSVRSGVIVR